MYRDDVGSHVTGCDTKSSVTHLLVKNSGKHNVLPLCEHCAVSFKMAQKTLAHSKGSWQDKIDKKEAALAAKVIELTPEALEEYKDDLTIFLQPA